MLPKITFYHPVFNFRDNFKKSVFTQIAVFLNIKVFLIHRTKS